MSATPPEQSPSAQSPETIKALASIDLSGGDEAPIQTFGRITAGLVLVIVGGVAALAFFAAYLAGWAIPAIADWVELLGDVLLWIAALALGIAITGFTLLRRGRKARAAEAAEAAAFISSGGLDAARAEAAAETPSVKDAGPPRETHL